jgi:hypothetical protein
MPEETVKSSSVLPNFHDKGFDYEQILNLAFRSARVFHPECRLVLLTSLQHKSAFSQEISETVEIFRYDVDHTQPIVWRSWAELKFLEQHDFSSHIVMMDSDMLINANLEDIFEENFDVGLTYNGGKSKADKKMPINGGLKIVHAHKRDAAIAFSQKIYELCNSEHLAQYRTWWGDQYALIEAIGNDNFWHRDSDRILSEGGGSILLLPCNKYNFSPTCKAKAIRKKWNDKKIIHFRGPRKQLMSMYWNLYLSVLEKRDFKHLMRALITRIYLIIIVSRDVVFGKFA